MASPVPVEPVKLICAILWTDQELLTGALEHLTNRWGSVDYASEDYPFNATDYYNDEMGSRPSRRLISFAQLFVSEEIRLAKIVCNEIEDELAVDGSRHVNLDIGYLDHNKIVLASCKFAGQKIHLGDGVYADLIARYRQGKFQPFEWTFPDFKQDIYAADLNEIRRLYLRQRRS